MQILLVNFKYCSKSVTFFLMIIYEKNEGFNFGIFLAGVSYIPIVEISIKE